MICRGEEQCYGVISLRIKNPNSPNLHNLHNVDNLLLLVEFSLFEHTFNNQVGMF